MRRINRWVVTLLALGLATLALANEPEFSSLQEKMSGRDFERSGLDKLSESELEYLNEWLREQGLLAAQAPAPAPAQSGGENRVGFVPTSPERYTIESSIVGEFRGWSGRTRFKLANGQVWQQVGGGQVHYRADSPAVRIEPKALGSWKLFVDGLGRGVKVRRVE